MPDPLAVVADAIRWYGANPQADVSPAEVIVAALEDAALLVTPPRADRQPHPDVTAPTAQEMTDV